MFHVTFQPSDNLKLRPGHWNETSTFVGQRLF